MIKVFAPGLVWYTNKIQKGECFSYVRYTDGIWNRILGLWDRRKDIVRRFPGCKNQLKNTILKPRGTEYYYAMQSLPYLSRLGLLSRAETWLRRHECNIQWHCGEVFHRASGGKRLTPLIKQLWKRPVTVVGPDWVSDLPFANSFIQIDSRNCWKNMDAIEKRLQTIPAKTIVAFSAGTATKVLMHRLFPVLGKTCWLIDFGSLWDPYCGVFSRLYHHRLKGVSLNTLR